MQESDFFVFITIILTALTAFFALVTLVLAAGVASFFSYREKVKKEREEEKQEFAKMADSFQQKMRDAEEKLKAGKTGEEYKQVLEDIRRDYRDLRNQAIHSSSYRVGADYGPTNAELEAQINALLATIAALQTQIAAKDDGEPSEEEIEAAGDEWMQQQADIKRGK